ncbi:hypothetical protein [Variovorax sp. PCZ-1]|uniref:hypothetical protein n=1 Tax=Variovorax sp. PCZ-1 TaxID=2835533 RepID=UPI001BCB79CD|nr:hypothetical protein [Variovorax sp. PCZ-1]MBS7806618.1 hypothetical protein [Variovorax sp. PCZ-1]
MNLSELGLYGHYVVVRTERANQLIKRDPREMPKHLRLLLLAVDGYQDLDTYSKNLKGFGDILNLVGELIQMDMVRLVDPALARQRRMSGKSADYMAMDSELDESRYSHSIPSEELFYGSTKPGSLQALVEIAHEQYPDYQPSFEAGKPISTAAQNEQVESLFQLLEAVRGERTELKQHLLRYKGLKKTSRNIREESKHLKQQLTQLRIISAVLLFLLLGCIVTHFV